MSRRIVFAGGSQTRALARLYRGEIAARIGDDVVFIGSGGVGTDAAQSTLLLADIVVMEIDEDGDAVPARLLPSNCELLRVPNLYADFLWPFAGGAHPQNRGAFALPGGPYPGEHGDRFLDRMVAEGVDEDEAIRRYLTIDMPVEGELDSRLTDRLAIMQRLDLASGFDLGGFVADHFRSQALFTTRQRLTLPMLRPVAAQLFGKLGVAGFDLGAVRRVPFASGAQPLHPAVISHFGLAYAAPGQAYPLNDEGFFTFEAFCRRYMRFAWNEVLHRGIQTAKTNPVEAVADLEAGLAASPDSVLGRQALAVARHAAGLEEGPAPDFIIDEESYDPAALFAAAPPSEALAIPPAALGSVAADEPANDEPEDDEPAFDVGAEILLEDDAEPAPDTERFEEGPETEAEMPEEDEAPPTGYSSILRRRPPEQAAQADAEAAVLDHGFTDFEDLKGGQLQTAGSAAETASNFLDVLPRMLPGFADIAAAADRPFSVMPETMPPPPLRPILPPELHGESDRPGLIARLLGRRQ